MNSLKAKYERELCVMIARDYADKKHIEASESFNDYVYKKYGLGKSQANAYKNIGNNFLLSNGETIFKKWFGLEDDLPVTTLALLLPLREDELIRAFEEFHLNAEMKMTEVKEIIDQVHVKKR